MGGVYTQKTKEVVKKELPNGVQREIVLCQEEMGFPCTGGVQ